MPREKEPPFIDTKPLSDSDVPFVFGEERFAEWFALKLVTDTFTQYEIYRNNNQDPRWNLNDMLYAQYVPLRNWPGTDVPRSALGLSLVFEQMQGAKPQIAQALFANPEWFSIEADIGADPQAARAQQAALEYGFDKFSEKRGTTPTSEMMLSIDDILLYGNGGVAVEFESSVRATGFYRVDPRDLYIDPFCSVPTIDGCRSVIWRRFMSVEEVRALRSDPRFNIPPDDELWALAQRYPTAQADLTKQTQEAARGTQYQPQWAAQTAAVDPAKNQLEILVYYSREKIVWVLQRRKPIFNSINPYGFIPICTAPCYPWPGRYHAMSVADAQEGYQRYMEALFNARLDAVSLTLFPPRWLPRGFLVTPQQQRWGPGAQFGVDNPKDVNFYSPPDTTSGIYQELGFIQASADRKTGLSAMAMSGMPSSPGAARTAAGVNAQQQGGAMRLYPIIKNIEDYLIIPLIQKSIKIMRVHVNMQDALPGKVRRPEDPAQQEYVQISGQAFQQATRVRVAAASKMLTRDRLMQEFPFVAQTLLQGPFMGALSQAGYTVDFSQFTRMLMDATGVDRYYQIIRQMTDEEKEQQKQQQEQQAQANAPVELEKARMDQETRLQIMDKKAQSEDRRNQTDLQIAQSKSKADPMESMMKQQEMQAKLQADQKKNEMTLYQKMMELQFKQKELEMKIEQARVGAQIKTQAAQNDMQIQAQRSEMEARMEQFRSVQEAQHQQRTMQHDSEMMGMERENAMQNNSMTQTHTSKMNELKQKSLAGRGRPTDKPKKEAKE